ncbi:MAG TPA: hypothetical protein VEK79_04050 [Thermoanaerobaculia bacterium]|nr:hypothetical protein [Thermoanaerobaculia bacterium]
MKAAVLIASRELRDRSRLFVIAAAMAIVPFAAVFTVRENRPLAIATVAAFIAAAYTCSLALMLGVSTVGRELTERRLSFLFAKPVSAPSIWAGKAVSALLTVLGAGVIVILPAYVFAHRGWQDMWSAGGKPVIAYATGMSIMLFFVGHAVSTLLRSRSAMLALDFAMIAISAITMFSLARPLLLGGGRDLVLGMLAIAALAMLLLFAIAPAWQLAQGRIDLRANHRALSTFLWSGAAIVLIACAAYTWWVITPPIDSMTEHFAVEQSRAGDWVYVSGQTPGRGQYLASFIVNTSTKDRERIMVSPWSRVHFSNDGRTIAWLEPAELLLPRGHTFRLYTRRLETGAEPVVSPLELPMPREAALSDDASRIAIIRANQIQVYEIATGNLLGAATVTTGDLESMIFAAPNLVRMVERRSPSAIGMAEFDVATKKFTRTPDRPHRPGHAAGLQLTADGSRVFLRREGTIIDARTGATLVTLPLTSDKPFFNAMLRDGSAIVTRDSKLYHFDRNGALVAEIPLPVQRAGVAAQIGASKLLLGVTGQNPKQWRMLIVDLTTHKVVTTVDQVLGPVPSWNGPVLREFPDEATLIGMDASRKLVMWDARTGKKRPFHS